jgi:DNA-binding MarR family transcriptional regulator
MAQPVDDVDTMLTVLLGRANRLARLLSKDGARRLGSSEAELLTAVRERSCSMHELADRLTLAQASVTRLVKQLDGAGFVRRARNDADGRVVHVSITDAGRAALDQDADRVRELVLALESRMSEKDLGALRDAGWALTNLIEELAHDPRPVLAG